MNNRDVMRQFQKAEGKRIRKKADKKAKLKERQAKQQAKERAKNRGGDDSWVQKVQAALFG